MATSNKGLETPAFNSFVNSWDVPVNANSSVIDAALGGITSIDATAASGTSTLSLSQYQKLSIYFYGALAGNVQYDIPSGVGGFWIILNSTSGAFTLKIGNTSGGTSVTVQQGYITTVFSEGSNIRLTNTLPITANSVTNAMLSTMSQNRLKGRTTSGTGNVEDITTSQALDFLSTVQGSVLYRGASSWSVLGPGTSGQFLTTSGAAADPTWATAPSVLPSQTGKARNILTTDGTSASWNTNSTVTARCTVTVSGTTPTLVADGVNVASVSRVAGPLYRLTFTEAMTNVRYQVAGQAYYSGGYPMAFGCQQSSKTLSYVDLQFAIHAVAPNVDPVSFDAIIYGGI